MGKWSMRMDAGWFVSAGVLIAGAAHAQADAIAVPPPLPLLRRWRRAWSSPTIEAAREGLIPIGTAAGSCGGAQAFAKAASAIAKPVAAGSLTRASTPDGRGETTALLRQAATC
jgi:hypothetical protein